MLRWTLRWQHISSVRVARPNTRIRRASTEPNPKPDPPSSPKTSWSIWIRRSLTPPVLHQPPFAAPLRWLVYAFAAVTTGHVCATYFYDFQPAYGVSMLPTFASYGDSILISKYYRRGRGIEAGDVVSFKHPVIAGEHAIKRVLAMGGDFVLMDTPGKSEAMIQVPQGHCWVVGDNMLHSRDSRMFGPLPLALISGKVIAKVDHPGLLPQFSWVEHGFQPAYIEDDGDVD